MLKIISSNQFRKDIKLAIKRGFDIEKLDEVVEKLANDEELPANYKDHALIGNYKDFRECHIEPNWILIYNKDNEDLELFLFRTGTHSDLFR